MDDDDLQTHFLNQMTSSATQAPGGASDHGAFGNTTGFLGGMGMQSGTALPGGYARELDGVSSRLVAAAESGDIADPSMSNRAMPVTRQRHVTTNEPPLPEMAANMVRGNTGAAGVVQDHARKAAAALQRRDVDPHRAMNSFAPAATMLKEYEWNEGGGLGVHQGMGVRFNTSSFNRYGRTVLPRDVPKKEPLPLSFTPRQQRGGARTAAVIAASRDQALVPRVRDRARADIAEHDHRAFRGAAPGGGGILGPRTRPDMLVHRSRRGHPDPRVSRVEPPIVRKNRTHALFAQNDATRRQRALLDDGF
jgi:hypothetical protein